MKMKMFLLGIRVRRNPILEKPCLREFQQPNFIILLQFIILWNAGNVFKGMFQNPIFCSILLVTSVLQVLIVQFGGKALHVAKDGLSGDMWALSLILGAFSLPLQQLINMFFTLGLNAKSWRQRLRLQRDASLRSWYQSNTAGHLHQE